MYYNRNINKEFNSIKTLKQKAYKELVNNNINKNINRKINRKINNNSNRLEKLKVYEK